MAFYVYILQCADGRYYTGHTDDMERRLAAHQTGTYSGYTYVRLPVKLVFVEDCASRDAAFKKERQIKGWSRAKKEALISGNWNRLLILANMKNNQPEDPSTSSANQEGNSIPEALTKPALLRQAQDERAL